MNTKSKYQIDPKEIRIYSKDDSCIFKKNNEEYGGLSNMATGFPLQINGVSIKTTEALYQACRFPHLPEIQQKIIEQKSPMSVKMISNANRKKSREDWDGIRLKVMKWCIQVKLAQNFTSFGAVLHETGLKNIVENSSKDNFWGAVPNDNSTIYTGKNALGRLLMDLRQTFYSKDSYSMLYVEPLIIEDFLLYGDKIKTVDERLNFINWLRNYWSLSFGDSFKGPLKLENPISKEQEPLNYSISESEMNIEEKPSISQDKVKKVRKSKKNNDKNDQQTQLFINSNEVQ